MGSIIDMERSEYIYRCNYVKRAIVIINLVGPPLSLVFLIFGVLRMILIKKRKTFLTNLIVIIFFSEILQCFSKMLQLIKYCFDDERDTKEYKGETYTDSLYQNERSIICQIQILLAIFSDFCSLFNTLLLSLRCYDVINNKKRFFDKGKRGIISIILFIILSLVFSIAFLFIDKNKTKENISYRFDVRDRCAYWCWLEHITSLYCIGFYWVVIFCYIFFGWKTNCYLKRGYKELIEGSDYIPKKVNDLNTPLNKDVPNNSNSEESSYSCELENGKTINLTKEEKKRIEDLKVMRFKCLIYPIVTICYWVLAATYRVFDDIFMQNFDEAKNPFYGEDLEKIFFEEHYIFQKVVQTFLVIYTLLSSIRGILYGFSFIVFEEKIFFNFFKKIWKLCGKKKESDTNSEEDKRIVNMTTATSNRPSNVSDIKEETDEGYNNQSLEMNENLSNIDN